MKKDLELQLHQTLEEIKQLDSYTDKATVMFTITQTEEKLKRDNIQGKTKTNQTHYEVGKKVRETILHSLPYFNQVIPIDLCFLWQFKSCPDDQPFYLGYPEFATFGGNKALPV